MNTDEAHTNYQEFKNWHRKDFWKVYLMYADNKVYTFYLTSNQYEDFITFHDNGFVKIITSKKSYEHDSVVAEFVLTELARNRLLFDYEL